MRLYELWIEKEDGKKERYSSFYSLAAAEQVRQALITERNLSVMIKEIEED